MSTEACGAMHDTGRTVFVCVAPAEHPPVIIPANGGTEPRVTPGHYFRSIDEASS